MIEVTETATNKFKQLMERKNATNKAVRLEIKPGGCSGFSYNFDFTNDIAENDKTWEVAGIKFVVDPRSYLFLKGTQLDYVDDLMEAGFKFINPNATASCGCGKSVSF